MAEKTPRDEQIQGGEQPVKATSAAIWKSPDGLGKKVSDCGDTIEIFIAMDGDIIKEAVYEIDGCVYTLACARAATALARDRTLVEATRLVTPERIDQLLGGLPEHNKHCAELAARAMEEALRDTMTSAREPWRKLYRK